MPGADIYGYGAIIIALIGLLTKVWLDSSKNTERVSDVIEKNAVALTELKAAVQTNTTATDKNTDHLTKLVLKIIKNHK